MQDLIEFQEMKKQRMMGSPSRYDHYYSEQDPVNFNIYADEQPLRHMHSEFDRDEESKQCSLLSDIPFDKLDK